MFRYCFTFLFLFIGGNLAFAQSSSDIVSHSFEGQIIRSFAVNPTNESQMLVGLKGSAGEGKVYKTEDAGQTWVPLNNDVALCDSCEDVQTVCFLDDLTYLAGTWKNGLYLTTNGGKKFSKMKKFPADDVRSVVKAPAGDVYAATTSHGILKTIDKGKTWQSPHKPELNRTLASWKLIMVPSANRLIYAMTFGNGLYKSMDGGVTWKEVINEKDMMIWDVEFINNEIYAVGATESDNYLFHAYLGDKKWKKYKLNMDGSVNSLHIAKTFIDYQLLIGTWGDGVQSTYAIEYSNEGYRCVSIEKNDTIGVADIWSNKDYIYNFSWGDGLKLIKRDLDCEISIPSIATSNCKSEPCFEIHSNCKVDYWNFKLYNRWGEFFMKDSIGFETTNQYMNNMENFKEGGQYIYWIKTSFEDNIDTFSLKGHITVDL